MVGMIPMRSRPTRRSCEARAMSSSSSTARRMSRTRRANSSPSRVRRTCLAPLSKSSAPSASSSSRICMERGRLRNGAGLGGTTEVAVAAQRLEIAELLQGQIYHKQFLS